MAKVKNDYFKLMEEQSAYCVAAAELLEEILTKATAENIGEYKDKMHDIEHRADGIHHDILARLTAEFITPIDQEDIVGLVQLFVHLFAVYPQGYFVLTFFACTHKVYRIHNNLAKEKVISPCNPVYLFCRLLWERIPQVLFNHLVPVV